MHCEYQEIIGEQPDNAGMRYVRCCHCGDVIHTSFTLENIPQAFCINPSVRLPLPPGPNIFQKGANYLAAYVRHRANGRPLCTPDQVLARFKICSPCEFYNDATGQCNLCGCWIGPRSIPSIPNKLTWSDEECPHPIEKRWQREDIKSQATNEQTEREQLSDDKAPINVSDS